MHKLLRTPVLLSTRMSKAKPACDHAIAGLSATVQNACRAQVIMVLKSFNAQDCCLSMGYEDQGRVFARPCKGRPVVVR